MEDTTTGTDDDDVRLALQMLDAASDDGWSDYDDDGDGVEALGDASDEPVTPCATVLACTHCTHVFTDRAMSVQLCADETARLHSVDVPFAGGVEEQGAPFKIATCSCIIRRTACGACGISVGYHVVGACTFCTDLSDNNSQYWMFKKNTAAESTTLALYDLPLNHAPHSMPFIPGPTEDAAVIDSLTCTICGDLMYTPARVGCQAGHTFCRVCISREVDARHSCPLDRQALTFQQVAIAEDVQQQLNKVRVHCRYGCEIGDGSAAGSINGQWQTKADGSGCSELVPLGSRELHESACTFKPPHACVGVEHGAEHGAGAALGSTGNRPRVLCKVYATHKGWDVET